MPLGVLETLREDRVGGFYELVLSKTSVADDIAALAADGLLGSSFRFSICGDAGEKWPLRSDGMPIRQVLDTYLYELGPVVSAAHAGTNVSLQYRDVSARAPRLTREDLARAHADVKRMLRSAQRFEVRETVRAAEESRAVAERQSVIRRIERERDARRARDRARRQSDLDARTLRTRSQKCGTGGATPATRGTYGAGAEARTRASWHRPLKTRTQGERTSRAASRGGVAPWLSSRSGTPRGQTDLPVRS
jgi:hypothetical protein